jgi:hypothetical protein
MAVTINKNKAKSKTKHAENIRISDPLRAKTVKYNYEKRALS